tara:strand:+ start:463331 stop:463765 length:435 start_codon:yes stop_codon:yes gene_type:complete
MKLSEHFTLQEMTFSETASRHELDNTPGPEELANLHRIANLLEQVRSLVGKPIIVTSGYRSPAVNKAVGSKSKNSAHTHGLAADIKALGMTPAALAAIIKTSDIKFDQLILEFDRWVHIGLREGAPRLELLTIRAGTGYMRGIV